MHTNNKKFYTAKYVDLVMRLNRFYLINRLVTRLSYLYYILRIYLFIDFPGGTSGKETTCQCRKQMGLDPWVGKITRREGMATHSNILKNPMDRGAWRDTLRGVAKNWTWLKQLSMQACRHVFAHGCVVLRGPGRAKDRVVTVVDLVTLTHKVVMVL